MKLLLDQGLPRTSAKILREAGCDVVHTAEIGLSRAIDSEILTAAKQQGRVVITLDADFHALLVLQGAVMPSVVRTEREEIRRGVCHATDDRSRNRCQRAYPPA